MTIRAGHCTRLQAPADFVGHPNNLGQGAVLEDHDELFAAVSRHKIGRAQAFVEDAAAFIEEALA